MRFGSVCSGIEAASIAWNPLGWEACWFAEVDAAASAVLAYRFPETPNLGDMTLLAAKVRAREIEAPDVLVGGTPCQAFSVAGMRRGLEDARGQLTLAFVDLTNAIDEVRLADGLEPVIIVWENVPGVLSSKDNAFGCFLAGVAGESDVLIPAGRKWTNAGAVLGPQRSICWRILDAQYAGLAQRRRRVFVVASARQGFDPATVLLEFDGVRRDSPPSRETGEGVAGTLDARTDGGGFPGSDGRFRPADGGLSVDLQNISLGDVCGTLDAEGQKRGNRGHGVIASVPPLWDGRPVSQTLDAVLHKGQTMPEKNRFPAVLQPVTYSIMPMNSGKDYKAREVAVAQPLMAGGPVGGNQGGDFVVQPIHFYHTNRQPEVGNSVDLSGPLKTDPSAVCVTGTVTHTLKAEGFDASEDGTGRGQPITPVIAFVQNSRDEVRLMGGDGEIVGALAAQPGMKQTTYLATTMAVRRLMPVECERLQGFPDNWTLVPNAKGKPAADGPRYKQCGNSMATNVMAWIGRRIQAALTPVDDFDELLR